jgi:hypothetical protein
MTGLCGEPDSMRISGMFKLTKILALLSREIHSSTARKYIKGSQRAVCLKIHKTIRCFIHIILAVSESETY